MGGTVAGSVLTEVVQFRCLAVRVRLLPVSLQIPKGLPGRRRAREGVWAGREGVDMESPEEVNEVVSAPPCPMSADTTETVEGQLKLGTLKMVW